MATDHFVLLLDILGFKALVGTTSLDDICGLVETTLLDECDNWTGRGPQSDFDTIHFSDTVVVHARKPGHYKEWYDDLAFIGSRICTRLFARGIPVRGAMSYGSFLTKRSGRHQVFLGQALIDAYLLEQGGNFLGFTVDERIWTRIYPASTAGPYLTKAGEGLVLRNGSFWVNPLSEFIDHDKGRLISKLEYDSANPAEGSGYLPSELQAFHFIISEAERYRDAVQPLRRVAKKYKNTERYLRKVLGPDLYQCAVELSGGMVTAAK